jgi:lipopolysaccharide/colanic/teichoic acid biosynthesis glycosyltransferase
MMQPDEQRPIRMHAGSPSILIPVPGSQRPLSALPLAPVSSASAEKIQSDWLALLAASQTQPMSKVLYNLALKRWFDVIAASLLLAVLAPLLALIALVMRIQSPGPAMYRQTRIGKHGEPFTIYKFRTMIPDRRGQRKPFDGEDRRKRHKTARDPRVTAAGQFLRRTSIDELPQLVNILRGDMSFIGPRPELPEIVMRYEDWQHQRHLVTPGLSGWWQVEGRSDLPMHENTGLDIYYVAHQSDMLDLKIVLRTFRALVSRGGAF